MKNTFKLGFLALVLAFSVASCDGNKPKTNSPDSSATKVDTAAKKDTAKVDTSKAKADTAKKK